jgi:poly-gamma-glutamate capsule biosynthesis protein CapA/YwtB (metallophosphatase superfamily)
VEEQHGLPVTEAFEMQANLAGFPQRHRVYRGRLVLYGCGDFLNDYEGIGDYEQFRGDLSLMYFPTLDPASGRLTALRMFPTQVKRFRVNRAAGADVRWLRDRLNREGKQFGPRIAIASDNSFILSWD